MIQKAHHLIFNFLSRTKNKDKVDKPFLPYLYFLQGSHCLIVVSAVEYSIIGMSERLSPSTSTITNKPRPRNHRHISSSLPAYTVSTEKQSFITLLTVQIYPFLSRDTHSHLFMLFGWHRTAPSSSSSSSPTPFEICAEARHGSAKSSQIIKYEGFPLIFPNSHSFTASVRLCRRS
jgi:hypothetical protein